MFGTGLTQAQLLASIQGKLIALRNALSDVQAMHTWASGIAATDLEAVGFDDSDAATLLTAINDANAIALLYSTGLPPSTYPQPASDYVYAASQAQVIGPQ